VPQSQSFTRDKETLHSFIERVANPRESLDYCRLCLCPILHDETEIFRAVVVNTLSCGGP